MLKPLGGGNGETAAAKDKGEVVALLQNKDLAGKIESEKGFTR